MTTLKFSTAGQHGCSKVPDNLKQPWKGHLKLIEWFVGADGLEYGHCWHDDLDHNTRICCWCAKGDGKNYKTIKPDNHGPWVTKVLELK
jgi:hypothetical protein